MFKKNLLSENKYYIMRKLLTVLLKGLFVIPITYHPPLTGYYSYRTKIYTIRLGGKHHIRRENIAITEHQVVKLSIFQCKTNIIISTAIMCSSAQGSSWKTQLPALLARLCQRI